MLDSVDAHVQLLVWPLTSNTCQPEQTNRETGTLTNVVSGGPAAPRCISRVRWECCDVASCANCITAAHDFTFLISPKVWLVKERHHRSSFLPSHRDCCPVCPPWRMNCLYRVLRTRNYPVPRRRISAEVAQCLGVVNLLVKEPEWPAVHRQKRRVLGQPLV